MRPAPAYPGKTPSEPAVVRAGEGTRVLILQIRGKVKRAHGRGMCELPSDASPLALGLKVGRFPAARGHGAGGLSSVDQSSAFRL